MTFISPKEQTIQPDALSTAEVKIKAQWEQIFCCGSRLWNNLPLEIHSVESIQSFKSCLKSHLLTLAFISSSVWVLSGFLLFQQCTHFLNHSRGWHIIQYFIGRALLFITNRFKVEDLYHLIVHTCLTQLLYRCFHKMCWCEWNSRLMFCSLSLRYQKLKNYFSASV